MKVAIMGAGIDAVQTIQEAKKLNIQTLALDEDAQAPGFTYADAHQVIDYTKVEEIIELLVEEEICFIMPFVEGDKAVVVGQINDALHLPGYGEGAASLCYDHYQFHHKLREKGLRFCHSFLLKKDQLFPPFEITYPAIVKPRYGKGDVGEVYYMSCPGDLVEFQIEYFDLLAETKKEPKGYAYWQNKQAVQEEEGWDATVRAKAAYNQEVKEHLLALYQELQEMEKQEKTDMSSPYVWLWEKKKELADKYKQAQSIDPLREYVLEEVFDGQEYAVDGALEGCNVELVMVRKKLMSTPQAQQAVGYVTVPPEEDRTLYRRIKEQLDAVLECVGLKDCLFRADVRVRGKEVFVIHLTPCSLKHSLHDEFLYLSTSIHLGKEYLCYMSGKRHNFQPLQVKHSMLHYFGMENCYVHEVPRQQELPIPEHIILQAWHCHLKTLDFLEPITTQQILTKRGYYILEGEVEQQLRQTVEAIEALFHTA